MYILISILAFTYISHPLNLPRTFLQCGHLCLTLSMLSVTKGKQKQGHNMVKQRMVLIPQAIMLGVEDVSVTTLIWQVGHTICTGW